jgi:hypothetical protein
VSDEGRSSGGGCGCFSVGGIVAMILSWTHNHSIIWLVVNGLCGRFYVIYFLIYRVALQQ